MQLIVGFIFDTIVLSVQALVFKIFWTWFIVLQFYNVPQIPFGIAMGFSLIFQVLNGPSRYRLSEINEIKALTQKEVYNVMWFNTFNKITVIGILFVFGWLIHHMM